MLNEVQNRQNHETTGKDNEKQYPVTDKEVPKDPRKEDEEDETE